VISSIGHGNHTDAVNKQTKVKWKARLLAMPESLYVDQQSSLAIYLSPRQWVLVSSQALDPSSLT